MKIFRICGYGSGRSALVVRLVEEFNFRQIKVPSLSIRINHLIWIEGSDNLRQHIASRLIANRQRWGLLCETPDLQEPDPIALASHLVACDLVLAVGFDHTPLPGLETLVPTTLRNLCTVEMFYCKP
jgi:molybdopterin-guanine dinucleotide biosynthesis protein